MSQTLKPRVRFAPSPTGDLHVGSVRTALFNWAYAKVNGGSFVLRIEDTDAKRSTRAFENNILEGLDWLGLKPDEGPIEGGEFGPYRQSERIEAGLYQKIANKLIEQGLAYYCFESEEELEAERLEAEAKKIPYVYSRKSLSYSEEEVKQKLNQGIKASVRFKVPDAGEICLEDMLRGTVRFDLSLFSDFMILKSDGNPSYNFAVVVDDIGMQISHVIRGEDHLSNTPKQWLIYEALGVKPPKFCHVPMILGQDRSKLSKRHGASAVTEYRDQGFLAESMVNFMALLGWSHPEAKELFSLDELATRFSQKRLSKSNAIFDLTKLKWMNGQYIKHLDVDKFLKMAWPFLDKMTQHSLETKYSKETLKSIFALSQEGVSLLSDITSLLTVFYESDQDFLARYKEAPLDRERMTYLDAFSELLKQKKELNTVYLKQIIDTLCETHHLKKGVLMKTLRYAFSAQHSGHALFDLLSFLGIHTLERRLALIKKIS